MKTTILGLCVISCSVNYYPNGRECRWSGQPTQEDKRACTAAMAGDGESYSPNRRYEECMENLGFTRVCKDKAEWAK